MVVTKSFLKEFLAFCADETAYENKRNENRSKINFDIIMRRLERQKDKGEIFQRYQSNINYVSKMLKDLPFVHNTNLDSVISILSHGLLSIDEMEKRDISFNFRISYRGITDELHKYVFAYPQRGHWFYGPCEIIFKKEIESLDKAYFLPESVFQYDRHDFPNYLMDLKYWREFLIEFIAISMEEPDKYFQLFPTYLRPEFLFENQIPVSYIECINCKGNGTYMEAQRRIKREFGNNSNFLNLLNHIE